MAFGFCAESDVEWLIFHRFMQKYKANIFGTQRSS